MDSPVLRKFTKLFVVVIAIALNLSLAISTYSQVTGANLSGTITDASGAAVPGAAVSAKNTLTGISADVTTDANGFYTIPNLQPAPYEVRTTAKGFSTALSNVTLAVGAQQTMNVSLKIGETSQTVEVTEAAPQIDLTSSTLSGQVESQTVLDLPLNGRDWTSLAVLHPGVAHIEEQMDYSTSARGNRGFGSELTISGQRTTYNNYRLDGITVNDYANSGPGNVIGAALGVDAIQEFSVLTGGFSAEYGRAAGGVVNAITKSGTNAFHGDVYEFLRNSALDSRDYFTRSDNIPLAEFRRNQFGGAAGGPIIKDKTFIFGDYEGLRQVKGIPTSVKVPSLAARAGNVFYNTPTAPAGCAPTTPNMCTIAVDPAATAMFAMYPTPTPGTINPANPNVAQFINQGVQDVPENFYTVRVDHKLTANDNLSGTYLFDDTNFEQPDAFNNDILNSHTRRQTVVIQESHTFSPSFVNAARVGFSRTYALDLAPNGAINPAAAMTSLGSTAGQNAPEVQINGFTRLPGGVGAGSYYTHAYNSFQAYDDAFWTHGAHTIKFGGGFERMQYNFEAFQNQGGLWKFNSIADFLNNNPYHFESGIPQSISPRELRQNLFAAYLQDDWRVKSNLTLNLGVRYEPTSVIRDAQDKIDNLVNISDPAPICAKPFTAANFPAYPGTSCTGVGPYTSNPTLHNFEPRIGFAWDPFKDGKTSVRGGFGIYDVLPLPGYFLLQQNQAAPFTIFSQLDAPGGSNVQKASNPFAGAFFSQGENLLVNPPAGTQPGRLASSTTESDPHRNYVEEWNLNIQRQLTSNMTLTVGYVGSHGVHNLIRGDDGNMTQPMQTPFGLLFPCGGTTPTPPATCTPGNNFNGSVPVCSATGVAGPIPGQINQCLGTIRYLYWDTDSSYNAMNVSLEKQLSHGLQFQIANTWQKSLDESSSTIAGDTFNQGLNSLFYMDPKSLRGPSDFNVADNLSINVLWVVPTPQSWTGFAHEALGGWQLGGIFTFNTGVPTTAIIGGDPMGLGNAGADQFGIPNRIPGCNITNSNFIGGPAPVYINSNCYTLPTVPASSQYANECGPFPGAATPAPAGQVYCANLLGNAGRNSVTGPHEVNMDFSLIKDTPVKRISETFNVEFRAEFFNVFNHSNFIPPEPVNGSAGAQLFNTDGSSSGAGQLDELATTPREIQFALKVIW